MEYLTEVGNIENRERPAHWVQGNTANILSAVDRDGVIKRLIQNALPQP